MGLLKAALLSSGLALVVLACSDSKPAEKAPAALDPADSIGLPYFAGPARELPSPHRADSIGIYLTFDDGPYECTPEVTALLTDKGVRSSFFMVGSQVRASPWHDSVFRSVAGNPLFRVYNHTYSHSITQGRLKGYYKDPQRVWRDIQRNKQALAATDSISRLPGMNTWRIQGRNIQAQPETTAFLEYLSEQGIGEHIVGWHFEWKMRHSLSKVAVDSLVAGIRRAYDPKGRGLKDIVILSHDYLYRTPESIGNLAYLIETLEREPLVQFRWVGELVREADSKGGYPEVAKGRPGQFPAKPRPSAPGSREGK